MFTDLHIDSQKQTPHLSVVAPLFTGADQAASPLGAIILVNDTAQFLYPLIQSWPTPSKTTEKLLVRPDGNTALFLNELRHRPESALQLRLPLTRTDPIAVMAALGQEGFVEGLDYRGMASLAAILPVPGFPWHLVTKDDTGEVLGLWRFRAALLMVLFAALLGGLGAFGLIAWQSIVPGYSSFNETISWRGEHFANCCPGCIA